MIRKNSYITHRTLSIVNLYNFDNALSDNDSNLNTGWSDTSVFFAQAMVSTDAGDNYSIGIETKTDGVSDTASITHFLPTLTVGVEYKATIRYKTTYDASTTIVQNPFFNWSNVSGPTYPTTYSSGSWEEVEVIFTPTTETVGMRIYPHWANGAGRTTGDLIEISSIVIKENI